MHPARVNATFALPAIPVAVRSTRQWHAPVGIRQDLVRFIVSRAAFCILPRRPTRPPPPLKPVTSALPASTVPILPRILFHVTMVGTPWEGPSTAPRAPPGSSAHQHQHRPNLARWEPIPWVVKCP